MHEHIERLSSTEKEIKKIKNRGQEAEPQKQGLVSGLNSSMHRGRIDGDEDKITKKEKREERKGKKDKKEKKEKKKKEKKH